MTGGLALEVGETGNETPTYEILMNYAVHAPPRVRNFPAREERRKGKLLQKRRTGVPAKNLCSLSALREKRLSVLGKGEDGKRH